VDTGTLLIQFAKWPEPGRVKTRLAAKLGDEGALDAHIRLTRTVMHSLSVTGHEVAFWWDQPQRPANAKIDGLEDDLISLGFMIGNQFGDDLGERMHNALAVGLQSHQQTIIVGSDCPSVDPPYIKQAIEALNQVDVVLGPSDDGGFVLIGARRVADRMLADVSWGTSEALEQTAARLTTAGLTLQLLEPRWDVDEPEDWQRFLLEFEGD
jgi:hypothetical protein